ncbi:thioredoxin family protein [Marinococcus halotolerans]|uniref:thioredoxin family protein n=1 Tax=Marinococcus halotolerans TaxID=301092 RepID=UPI0003B431F5|nr:thioredoxin family protein [Marinococcus halotolerans]
MERITNEQLEQMLEAGDGRRVVLFTSPTCGTCQLAKRMLAPIEKLYAGASFLEVDINTAPVQARQLEIQSVPCLIVFDSGEERERLYKMQSGSYLLEQLHTYLKKDLTEKKEDSYAGPSVSTQRNVERR